MKKPVMVGPWPLGIDNVSTPTAVRSDDKGRPIALCDAVNVDIDRAGDAARRRGARLAVALPGLHSGYTAAGGVLGVASSVLYRLNATAAVAIAALPDDTPACYADVPAGTVVCQRRGLQLLTGDSLVPLAPPDGQAPALTINATGGLHAGRYGIAVAYVTGQAEGGLSPLGVVQVEEGQGIQLGAVPLASGAEFARVYRTEPDGTVLYHAADMPLGMPNFLIGVGQLGRQPATQYLARMPGVFLAAASWRSRLLVARGRTLYVSEPFSPGLYSPRYGFVQFDSRITMLAGVDAGVFVGTANGVLFLRGGKPDDWVLEEKGTGAPAAGGVTYIDGNQLPASFQQAGRQVAIWLSPTGFVLGCDDGSLIEPQSDRLVVDASGTASIAATSRRVTATLN